MDDQKDFKIDRVLTEWQSDPSVSANILAWQTQPAQQAIWHDIPSEMNPAIVSSLNENQIFRLYSHQFEAWQEIKKGHHIVVVTGTSSGKTLCYNLPVLDYIFSHPKARALYFFPTKALAQDQVQSLRKLVQPGDQGLKQPNFDIYDGDTPADIRPIVRKNSNIILTNPDMIHIGILPHHTIWQDFFRNLRFVVIDEMHSYRGVFGSHVANLLRRLRRVARFYGSDPQFILTSATIANPAVLAERLVEAPVSLIEKDGANHGARHFLVYNPPVVDHNTGLRRSSVLESVQLATDLLDNGVQSIIFSRTRRSVELALTYLRSKSSDPDNIHGYRSGYLPAERRAIERGLKNGAIRAVVATNALELGIDIGGMDAVVMIGYPGTIAATRQEAGRAGRKADDSLAVLVASADPLDQFLAHHPEYLFEQTPEQALIQPDHLLIVLNHIRCAAFELPFKDGESFGAMHKETVAEFLQFLVVSGLLHQSHGQYYWMADQYPANEISLRSTSPGTFLLQVENENQRTTIGQVDDPSAYWMVHPQAVYFHEGQQYLVKDLDIARKIALLEPFHLDYFTEPLKETTVEQNSTIKTDPVPGGGKAFGELVVTNQVTGFRRVKWATHEILDSGMLDLPPTQLNTSGYWLWLDEKAVEKLQSEGLWTNAPNDYGPGWQELRKRVLIRDHHRCQICGSIGLENGLQIHHKRPFRTFASTEMANELDNLITLCPTCHRKVEQVVRIRSGLAGAAFLLGKLAPLFLMCDEHDLGISSDPQSSLAAGQPAIVIYDNIPGGIGLSEHLYDLHAGLVAQAIETVTQCDCSDGCPSCVGPAGENGMGGKRETLAIFSILNGIAPLSIMSTNGLII